MGFTEKTHAFISALYYKYLTETFKERGKQAFIMGTNHYARQRGMRMAQRAIRDGKPLNYASYIEYGEWVPSEELKKLGKVNDTVVTSLAPDYTIEIHSCPWADTFIEMGLKEGGKLYCKYLDTSIAQGFSPEIKYSVPQTLYEHGFCIQKVMDSKLKEGEEHPKHMEYVKGFDFHTSHAYYAFKETAEGIFGKEGTLIAQKVLNEFNNTFGKEMTEVILSYKDTNFNKA